MQIAGWLLREPFSRAGDVLGVRVPVGPSGVMPRHPGPPGPWSPAVSQDTGASPSPSSTLLSAWGTWGDAGSSGDRVDPAEALGQGDSWTPRSPSWPPGSVLWFE